MAKDKCDNMLIPPDGGEWTFVMITGKTYQGTILERHDDGVIIDAGNNIIAALRTDHIQSMWQGLAQPENIESKEA